RSSARPRRRAWRRSGGGGRGGGSGGRRAPGRRGGGGGLGGGAPRAGRGARAAGPGRAAGGPRPAPPAGGGSEGGGDGGDGAVGRGRAVETAAEQADKLAQGSPAPEGRRQQTRELLAQAQADRRTAGRDRRLLDTVLDVHRPRETPTFQVDNKTGMVMVLEQ